MKAYVQQAMYATKPSWLPFYTPCEAGEGQAFLASSPYRAGRRHLPLEKQVLSFFNF